MGQDRHTLLYVEDDPDARKLFEYAAQSAQTRFRLQQVDGVPEAMDYLAGRGSYRDRAAFPRPECVLLDYALRNTTGIELLTWMRASSEWVDAEVAMFSTSDEPQHVAGCYVAGADYYLQKPFELSRLVVVASAIDGGFNGSNGHPFERLVRLPEYRVPPQHLTIRLRLSEAMGRNEILRGELAGRRSELAQAIAEKHAIPRATQTELP